jgi:tRNA1(Val) A37 N6-methylase TrmN6
VDRVITNPPFGSLKDAQGQTKMFQRGLLTTSQLDHAIALKALDLKPDGRAVLILGGKIGEEITPRTVQYPTNARLLPLALQGCRI